MSGYKTGRMNEEMKRVLSEIIRELKDPRISGLLSVVRVEVSGDMSDAKIYVSAIEGEESTAASVKGLKSAAGFIKRELSARLKMRKMPQLWFIADNSIAHSAKISGILSELTADKPNGDA